MKRHFALLLSLGLSAACSSQVTIDQNFTIQEYVNDVLLGSGVTASNVTLIGDSAQLGELSDTTGLFSVDRGLVLSSGDVNRLADCGAYGTPTGLGSMFADQDLLDVANSVPALIGQSFVVSSVQDGCVLEFDFIAFGDSISFNYVFGSDEYLGYVNTQFNDIFAFFLSGPGIVGPYASPVEFPDGAINIAQVPETDPILPITISSVNDQTNPQFYIDNPNQEGICINGYTTTFTANASVQCGETYHIKLAIADGSDSVLDSFILLEAGSFVSNGINISAENYPYESVIGLPEKVVYGNGLEFPLQYWIDNAMESGYEWGGDEVDGVAIEGCNDAEILISRDSADALVTDTIFLTFSGSANLGQDFLNATEQYVLEPGMTELMFGLEVVADTLLEGVEDIIITQETVSSCGDTLMSSLRWLILDPIELTANQVSMSCLDTSQSQVVEFNEIQGFGPFTYSWTITPPDTIVSGILSDTLALSQSISTMDEAGIPFGSLYVSFELSDLCGQTVTFTDSMSRFLVLPDVLCVDTILDFPAINSDFPVEDVLVDGLSLLTDSILVDTLSIQGEWQNDLWTLTGIETGGFDWSGEVVVIDSCGVPSSAQWYILEYPCTEGCTDDLACNYLGDAGIEDGSCEYMGDPCVVDSLMSVDGVLSDSCDCVLFEPVASLVEANLEEFSVAPNPSQGRFRFVGVTGPAQLRLFALDGRLVHQSHWDDVSSNKDFTISVNDGLYLIEVIQEKSRSVARILIQNE